LKFPQAAVCDSLLTAECYSIITYKTNGILLATASDAFYVIYSDKNLFLPPETIFASPVFPRKKRFFPLSGKNRPTLMRIYASAFARI